MKVFTLDDINIIVGQNSKENWSLLDSAKQNHLWFHLDKLSSPYVIIEHSDPPHNVILQACQYCKEYSKWKGSVKVIYTTVKNVNKGTEIGQAIISGKTKSINL